MIFGLVRIGRLVARLIVGAAIVVGLHDAARGRDGATSHVIGEACRLGALLVGFVLAVDLFSVTAALGSGSGAAVKTALDFFLDRVDFLLRVNILPALADTSPCNTSPD